MTTITINKSFVRETMEQREDGSQPAGYWALNAQGKGETVAVISGPVTIAPLGVADCLGGKVGQDVYALRDILNFARRGERGLTIVEDHEVVPTAAQTAYRVTEPHHKGDLNQF